MNFWNEPGYVVYMFNRSFLLYFHNKKGDATLTKWQSRPDLADVMTGQLIDIKSLFC